MTKGRENAAKSLGDVIELLRLRRHNGILSVERTVEGRFEEGEIYFQGGLPTYARTGQMVGQEALIWLLSWHQVYFTFLANEPQSRQFANISATATVNTNVPVANNAAPPRYPQGNASGPLPIAPPRLPQTAENNVYNGGSVPANAYTSPNTPANTPGLEWLIPRKIDKDRNILSLPLTRPQRSIYLLVDGHRTISDLARCTRKSMKEIERLLSELQERGLIAV